MTSYLIVHVYLVSTSKLIHSVMRSDLNVYKMEVTDRWFESRSSCENYFVLLHKKNT